MRISLEYQELESILRRWGEWQERHYLDVSLPHQSAHTLIYSDQPAGHKVLCAEMTKAVWLLNYQIERLKPLYQDTLLVWYAVNIKPQGGWWDPREKAALMGLRLNTLQTRVTRARKELHRKIFLTVRQLGSQNMSTCITAT